DDAERARKGEPRAHLALLVARGGEGGGHLGGRRRGHLLGARHQDEVVEAERDSEDAVAERDAPRGAGALDLRGRDARESEPPGGMDGPPPFLLSPRQGSGGRDRLGPAPGASPAGAPSRPPGAPTPGPVRSRRTSSA